MPPRNTTKPNEATNRLTPQQATAIDLLVSGKTLTDTAAVLGVDRATVSGWVNHHAAFLAALNSRRQEAFDGAWSIPCGACFPKPWPCLKKNWTARSLCPPRSKSSSPAASPRGWGGPPARRPWKRWSRRRSKREIDRTLTALTPEDVRLAEERRQSDRTFAALTAFP